MIIISAPNIEDSFDLEEDERKVLDYVIKGTYDDFRDVLELADVDTVRIGGSEQYEETRGEEMRGQGSSLHPHLHNPVEAGELLVFTENPLHVPHEMAHQVEEIVNHDLSPVENAKATRRAFSEAFAYLNQLHYFSKMKDSHSVPFEDLEQLGDSSWQEYNIRPDDFTDLYHPVGFKTAVRLQENGVEPREMLAERQDYQRVVEDALAAAWVSAKRTGEVDDQEYEDLLDYSIERRTQESYESSETKIAEQMIENLS